MSGTYAYWRESLVSVQAIPEGGYYLDRWELDGAIIEPYNYTSVHMETIHSLHAVFIQLDPGHGVAVKGISSKTVVGQGCSSTIKTLFVNVGSYTEIFNVTVYVNETSIDSKNLTLQSGASKIVTFAWNTTGFVKGNYTLTAYARPIPNETDTADNILTGNRVMMAMIGDLTGEEGWSDGKCDMRDIGLVSRGFGANRVTDEADPKYGEYWHPIPCDSCPHSPICDVVQDLKIDMKDIGTVARHFGETDP